MCVSGLCTFEICGQAFVVLFVNIPVCVVVCASASTSPFSQQLNIIAINYLLQSPQHKLYMHSVCVLVYRRKDLLFSQAVCHRQEMMRHNGSFI